jgi:hypothetical protein
MLYQISSFGVGEMFSLVWNSIGGNLSSLLFRLPSILAVLFLNAKFGMILSSVFTLVILVYSFHLIYEWAFRGLFFKESKIKIIFIVLCLFSFEGIFSPGLVNAYHFSGASTIHLWPYAISVIAIRCMTSESRSLNFISLVLFFLSANAGIAEGVFLLFASIGTLFYRYRQSDKSLREFIGRNRILIFTLVSIILANLITFSAPGIQIRSKTINGAGFNLPEITLSFIESTITFVGDFLTHPLVYLAFFCGYLVGRKFPSMNTGEVRKKSHILLMLTILVLFLNISGSTFSYAAWHQSVGLFFIATPGMFLFGFSREKLRIHNLMRPIAAGLMLVSFITVGRGVFLAIERGMVWDQNLPSNYCKLIIDPNYQPLGAPNTYPPLDLGVTDIDEWEWMKTGYDAWLLNMPSSTVLKCN